MLLYGLDLWVRYLRIGKILGGFNHRAIQRLTGRMLHQSGEGTWTQPTLGEAMVETGLHEIETYSDHRQKTVVQHIASRTIVDLCLAEGRSLGGAGLEAVAGAGEP